MRPFPLSRRALLGTGAALLAAPRIGNAQATSTLRFVPQTDLAVLDPIFTTRIRRWSPATSIPPTSAIGP